MYNPTLLDHFRHPRNVGLMRDPDGAGESENPVCGDLAKFFLRVIEGKVAEARFQTYGCGPSIAASSLATELIRGLTIDALAALTPDAVETALGGLPPDRRHSADLVVDALRAAAQDYRGRAVVVPEGGAEGV